MDQCNKVYNAIVPRCELIKDEHGKHVDLRNYKQMVGFSMYMLATILDLAYSVCLMDRYMEIPIEVHLAAIRRILRYSKRTRNMASYTREVTCLSYKVSYIQTMHKIIMKRKAIQAMCSCLVQDQSLLIQRNNPYLLYLPLKLNLLQQPHMLVKACGFKIFSISLDKLGNLSRL